MRPAKLLFLLSGLLLANVALHAQTVIFTSNGASYNNTDAVTTDTYGPVNISNCSSVSFSVNYNFSLPFPGGGNMESSDECPFSGGCAGDPNDPSGGGCATCWDFIYVQYRIDGAVVGTRLVGVPGSIAQSGTLSFGPLCTNGGVTADIIVQTQTWAANETITFSNINITCWDSRSNLTANPDPVCSGQPFTLTATLNHAPSVNTTQWTGPGTIVTPANLVTAVNNAPVGTNTYTFTATDDNACTATNTISVTVNPGPTMDDPPNITVCALDPVNVAFNGTGSPDFNWTNSNAAIGLGTSGMGDISFNAAAVAAPVTGTITVTPSTPGCTGPPQSFTVTVNPLPSANQPADAIVCAGQVVTRNFTGSPGATFSWTNDNPAIGLGGSGNGNINFTTANVTATETGNITITPMIGTCAGTPISFMVTVNPAPTMDDPPNITVCASDPVNVAFNGTGSPDFNWTNSNAAIGLATSGMGDISFNAAAVAAPVTGTITITPSTPGCTGPTQSFTVTVNPSPSANQPADAIVCAGQVVTRNFTGSPGATFSWTNDNPAIGLGGSGSGNINFTSANVATTETGNITITPMIGTCAGTPISFMVTVNPAPTMDDPPNITVCSSDPVNVAFSGTGASDFNWTNSNPAIGLPNSGMGDISFNASTVAASTTGTITVTPSTPGCVGPTQSFTVTVSPAPSANQPMDISVCAGQTVTRNFSGSPGATFTWTNDNPAIGLGSSGNGNINFSSTNVSATETANITVTPMIGSCAGDPVNFTITVNPAPTMDDPANQTVCAGELVAVSFMGTNADNFNWTNSNIAIGLGGSGTGDINFTTAAVVTPITGTITVTPSTPGCTGPTQSFTVTVNPMPSAQQPTDVSVCAGQSVVKIFSGSPGATFSWTNDNPAIGLGSSGNGNLNFISDNVATAETATITVTPMTGGCAGDPVVFNVTVNPAPSVIDPPNQTVCAGELVAVSFMGTGAADFNWTNSNIAIGLGSSGNGDINFTAASVAAPVTGNLSVTPSENGCNGPVQNFSITVTPAPTMSQPADITACAGTAIDLNFTGSTGATFNWSNSNPSIDLAGSGSGDLHFTAATPSASETAIITVEPLIGSCTGAEMTFSITIDPAPQVIDPPNQTVCSGTVVAVNFSGSNNPTFDWTNSNTATGLAASGSGDISFTAAGTGVSTITVTPSENGCNGAPQTFDITVTESPVLDLPADLDACAGTNVALAFTGTPGATFSWTNDNTAVGLAAGGTGDITFTAANVTTLTNASIQVTPNLGTCTGAPQNFDVIINPLPAISLAAVSCASDLLTYEITLTSTGNTITASAGTVSGSGGNFTVSGIPAGTNVTLTSTNSTTGCQSQQAVNAPDCNCAPVAAATQPIPQTICEGATLPALSVSTAAGTTVDWYAAPAGGTALLTGNSSYTPSGISMPGVYSFYAEARDLASDCRSATRIEVTLTINAVPTVVQPVDQEVCAGTPVSVNFSGSASAMLNWTNSNTTAGLGASGSGNIGFTTTNAGTNPLISNIIVTPSLNGCNGAPQNFNITVNPIPALVAPANQSVCAGASIAVAFSGNSGAIFNWTNSNTAVGLAASGAGDINFVTDNVSAITTANVSVTPSLAGCSGAAQNFSITVNPVPEADTIADQSACAGETIAVNFSGTNGATFNWTNSNTAIGLAGNGTGNISFSGTQTGSTPTSANIQVTPVLNTCPGAPQNFTLSVNPLPVFTVDSTVCSADLTDYTIYISSSTGTITASAGTVSGSGNQFTISAIPGGSNVALTAENAAGCISQQTVNAPNCFCPPVASPNAPNAPVICEGTNTQSLTVNVAPGLTADWYLAPTGGTPVLTGNNTYLPTGPFTVGTYTFYAESRDINTDCTSPTRTPVTLSVTAAPVMTAPADQEVCAGTPVAVQFSASPAGTFSWINSTPGIGLAGSGSGNIAFTAAANGTSQTALITVTPQSGSCAGTPQSFSILVNPVPMATVTGDDNICSGTLTTLTAGGGTNVSWSSGQNTVAIQVTPLATTTYTATVTENTCSSTASITVTVGQPGASTIELLTCDPAEVGTSMNTIQNAAGCDSVITTITTLDVQNCAPAPALSNGSVSCFGSSDGALSLSASGGLAPYQYSWSNGTQSGSGQIINAGGSIQIQNLAAGSYTITVTAANGLSATQNAQVSAPALLTATATAQLTFGQYPLSCYGSTDAIVQGAASGGTAQFQYSWNVAGQNTSQLTGVGAGTYVLTVTDSHQCSATASVVVQDPPPFEFDIVVENVACGEESAAAVITPLNGEQPFNLAIDGITSPGGLTPEIPGGEHLLVLSDANGCEADTLLTIPESGGPTITLPAETRVTLGETLVLVAETNLTAWQNLLWTPVADSSCLNCLRQEWMPEKSQIYKVFITDSAGCSASASIRVIVDRKIHIYVPNVFSPDDDGTNDFWKLNADASVRALNSLAIFDRWGDMVYLLDADMPVNEWPGWDGRFRGREVNPGVYVYYLEATLITGEQIFLKGDLTVVR